MADNTTLNVGSGGDTVRDLGRQSGTVKTQVIQLDLGGPSANAEVLITAGQQVSAASVPVVVASDQSAQATIGQYDRLQTYLAMQALLATQAQLSVGAGFVPMELPAFLIGI